MWDSLGGKLAERWAAVSGPALTFWLGGLLVWLAARDGLRSLDIATAWLTRRSGPVQWMFVLAAVAGIAASGLLVKQLTRPALALLEGYWPGWLDAPRRRLVGRVSRRADADAERFQELAGPVHDGTATAGQRAEFAAVDGRLRRLPTRDRLLPTRVGNVLRAAETRPIDKYGLDPVVAWPHLWLVFPEPTRQELTAARRSLDLSVAAAVWGVLFVAFAPLAWWAAPAGLAVAAAAGWGWVPARAAAYADLVEASVDLHRPALYASLRWPPPRHPDHEREQGRLLTTYLRRGLHGTAPAFQPPSAPDVGE
ncbi:hypothetical protein [Dactylosporangium sp. NPDC048998]|uniref:hypothetical protein n=1 Tax=Dactylosporangium sp. NPDC048998 TaxID=3363976 RepID=UPI00371BF52D